MKPIGLLCIITDTTVQNRFSHLELAEMAVKAGADMIQLREKNMSTSELLDTAITINKICRKYNVLFIINDRVDIALMSDADGVHLGRDDLSVKDARKLLRKNKIIGRTAHSLKEALVAERDGADYIGYGHIFSTSSKFKAGTSKGLINLEKVCRLIKIPVLAIGGINISNAKSVMEAGAHGIAVISAVAKSKNPYKAVIDLRTTVSNSVNKTESVT